MIAVLEQKETIKNRKFKFKTKPLKHQLETLNFAKKHDKFLLADETGLGKTKQIIDIAVYRKVKYGLKHCLILCGVNGLRHNWIEEIEKHSDESVLFLGKRITKRGKVFYGNNVTKLEDLEKGFNEFFIVANVEILRHEKINQKLFELTTNGTIDMVVIDEVHKLKNPESKIGKSIHDLHPKYRVAITGTPLVNRPVDLFNVLKWLGVFNCSYYSFKKIYCQLGGNSGEAIVSYKNLKDLRQRLESVTLRRKKEDVLDLPPKIRTTEYVEMTPQQTKLYKEVKEVIKENIHRITLSPDPLSQLVRLRQVTSHPEIISDTIKESAKFIRLEQLLEDITNENKKAIVFSNYVEVINIAYREFQHYNPAIITGKVKDKQRQIEKFKNDDSCKVLFGTIKALGTGFTLTEANYVIFIDKPWTLADTIQAEDRIHRIGTNDTVHVITLVCKDTIDERVEQIIQSKEYLTEGLVEGDEIILNQLNVDDKKILLERLLS